MTRKKLIKFTLVFVGVSLFYFHGYCQEKKEPPPPQTQVPDSLRRTADPRQTLPTINLQDIVITGRRRIEVLESSKLSINPENVFFKAPDLPLEGRILGKPEPLKTSKREEVTDVPVSGKGNEAYIDFGRYMNLNAGVKYKRFFERDVLYLQTDYSGSGGHVDNADFQNTRLFLSGRREISEGFKAHLDGNFTNLDYKFFGSNVPNQKRTRLLFNGVGGIEYKKLNKFDFFLDVGGKVGNLKDYGEISESGLSIASNIKGYLGKHILRGNLQFMRDNLTRDDNTDNLQYFTGGANLSVLLVQDFLFRFGGAFYNYKNTDGTDGSRFYPDVGFNINLHRGGELFFGYNPRIMPVTFSRQLENNKYIVYDTPLGYEDEKVLINGGWRKKASNDLTLEIGGTYRKIENFGIYQTGVNSSFGMYGLWEKQYGAEIESKELKISLFYSPISSLLVWFNSIYRAIDFTENSTITGKVPYIPTFQNDILMIYSPAEGWELKFDGIFANQRYVEPKSEATLNQFFIWNFIVGKKINKNLEINASFYNIFNHKFSFWNGYPEPDFITSGGLKYYW